MKIQKTIFASLLFSVLGLTGCGTVQNYERAVYSWEGAPARTLLKRWGHPNQTETLANGHRIYLYRTVARGVYPRVISPNLSPARAYYNNVAMTNRMANPARDGVYPFECTTVFEANQQGRIVHTGFHGNDCVASERRARATSYLK